ncbi:MAG: thymidine phosphorylase [Planctomycetota bacterium]
MILSAMRFHPARINQKKRDGVVLTTAEIADLLGGVVDGSLGDAQLGAFLMAVCCRGMNADETAALTLAMRDSGECLPRRQGGAPRVDKHSTGGVGDKVSLALAPLCAAVGLQVPMISGRGLGHTGGTIDKLAAIPGYRTDLEPAELLRIAEQCGYAMAGASAAIAPADRRMYALRDVTGTVESIPLITASILSKKLAESLDGLVMDVKCGRAAFMPDRARARELAQGLVRVGALAGTPVSALVTDMDRPLGRTIGNRLELLEAVALLRGKAPADFLEVTLALAAEMLILGTGSDEATARARLREAIDSGAGLEVLRKNIELQGGDPRFLEDPQRMPISVAKLGVAAARTGYVADIDPLALGVCAMDLGAGRRQATDTVDLDVGIVLMHQVGEHVEVGEPLAMVFARSLDEASSALPRVLAAIRIEDVAPPHAPLVLEKLSSQSRAT